MRPARSLTELLFGPALTVTAWSDQPNPGPATPPARDPRALNWFLGLGLGGLAALLTGLIWDAGQHARDPELAHREGLLTLANPGHLLLFLGIVAAATGMARALWAGWGWPPTRAGRAVLLHGPRAGGGGRRLRDEPGRRARPGGRRLPDPLARA
jgi:hypothetical protein